MFTEDKIYTYNKESFIDVINVAYDLLKDNYSITFNGILLKAEDSEIKCLHILELNMNLMNIGV